MKTDNHNPSAKLALRRKMLAEFHGKEPLDVFDACQGNGLLWRTLSAEFNVRRYWGVDFKAKPGRLKVDSTRVLELPGWIENVIDVDTYGSPWRHWLAILKNGTTPLTVFLTIGRPMPMAGGARNLSRIEADILGLGNLYDDIPPTLTAPLADLATDHFLDQANRAPWQLESAQEAVNPGGNARYIGVRLARKDQ